jgi:hypothetical protein
MAFKKGQSGNPNGRPKGAPNKTTTAIKTAVLEAFNEMGGVPALLAWGRENQTEFYKIAARLIPAESSITVEGGLPPFEVVFKDDASD